MRQIKLTIILIGMFLWGACQTTDAQEDKKGITIDFSEVSELPTRPMIIQKINDRLGYDNLDTITLTKENPKIFIPHADSTEGFYNLQFDEASRSKLIIARTDDHIIIKEKPLNGQTLLVSEGSYGTTQLEKYQDMRLDFTIDQQNINAQYGQAVQSGDKKKIDSLEMAYIDLEDAFEADFRKEINESKWTIANLFGIEALFKDRHFDLYTKIYDDYKGKTIYADKLKNVVEQERAIAVGAKAPAFELPDTEGNMVSLESFKGNYVMIDFWAAWCGPCRRENPNVKKVYEEFKDDGFQIVGVSIDRTEEQWKKAIKDDGLTWTQLSAIKQEHKKITNDYRVVGIPLSVLVDPEGIIVAKNLRGPRLHRTIAEIYN